MLHNHVKLQPRSVRFVHLSVVLASVVNSFEGSTPRENYIMGALLIVFTVIPAANGINMETPRDMVKEWMATEDSSPA